MDSINHRVAGSVRRFRAGEPEEAVLQADDLSDRFGGPLVYRLEFSVGPDLEPSTGDMPAITTSPPAPISPDVSVGLVDPQEAPVTLVNNAQPTLALTQLVVRAGIFPSRWKVSPGFDDDAYVTGQHAHLAGIRTFAGSFAPGGSLIANGALVPISTNTALFSLLGTMYGGNGVNTFGLPNLIGTLGQGQNSWKPVGSQTGSDQLQLVASQMPVGAGGSGLPVANEQKSLTTSYVINVYGDMPSAGQYAGVEMIGVVSQFGGNFAPYGTMFCDGSLLSIAVYPELYAVIGTTYGGDGQTTFALPDLRGRTVIGAGTGFAVGEQLGSEYVTFGKANLPTAMGGGGVAFDNRQPSLVLNQLVAVEGLFPSSTGNLWDVDNPIIGEVIMFAGSIVPKGWAEAQGQLLSINQNQALFSILGTTYGGNGQTNFALPNLVGRSIVGTNFGSVPLGQQSGSASTTLTLDDIPSLSLFGTPDGDTLYGANQADSINGGAGADTITAHDGDDRIAGGSGDDTIDGGAGSDRIVMSGLRGDYSAVDNGDGSYTVTDRRANADGADRVRNVEFVEFSDGTSVAMADLLQAPPSGADKTITIVEDGSHVFAAGDFGFSDPVDGDAFTGVVVTTLPASGDLYLNGVAITAAGTFVTAEDIAAGLLTYRPDPNGNGTGYATFTFQVRDDGVATDPNPDTITFNVTAVNDAPVNVVANTLNLGEDATGIGLSGMSISDPDAGGADITVTFKVTQGTISFRTNVAGGIEASDVVNGLAPNGEVSQNGSGTIVVIATISQINATLAQNNGLTYTPNANFNGADSLTVITNDGGNSGSGGERTDTDVRAINISETNDAPTVTDSTQELATILEDQPLTSANAPTVAALFGPSFSDSTDDQDRGGANPTGSGGDTFAAIIVVANGSSAGTGQWQYLSGGVWTDIGARSTSSGLVLGASTQLRFNPASNYNGAAPTLTAHLVETGPSVFNSPYNLSTNPPGGTRQVSAGTVTIGQAITAVNDAPTSTGIANDSVTFTEGQALAALLDASSNAGIADVDSANFDGGTLTVAITGGLVAAEDRLVIRLTGTVSFNASAVFVNGVQIGTHTGNNTSGPLVFTFDPDATPAAVAELMRAIAYNNVGGDDPTGGNRTIGWTLVDGDGQANGGQDTLSFDTTVAVNPVNDAPQGADETITIDEDGSHVFNAGNFNFTDPLDGDSLAGVVLTTLPASGDLYLNGVAITVAGTFVSAADIASGLLTYEPNLNGNGSAYASFTFQVRDNGGILDGGVDTDPNPDTITVNVVAIDDVSEVSAPTAEVNYVENQGARVIAGDLVVTDPDGMNGVIVSIGAGYVSGQDVLGFTAMHGITGTFDAATGRLVLTGAATAAQYQDVLRSVTYANGSDNPSTADRAIEFSVVGGGYLYNSASGHFYEFVPGSLNWNAARDAAAGRELFGLQGYLVTVTSAEEQSFITARLRGSGWMGANDSAVEGEWRWVTGPEAGQQFWSGPPASSGGNAVGGAYTNWVNGEPNNHPFYDPVLGEDYANLFANGGWNDFGANATVTGYVVEYGGMLGDMSIGTSVAKVTLHVLPVNDAPAGADKSIIASEDDPYVFTANDFGFSDPVEGDDFAGVVLTTLPAEGDLRLNGVNITVAGTFITATDIEAGLLTFLGDPDEFGTPYASFTFQVRDDGGLANGGVDTDQSPNTITIDVTADNFAPVLDLNGAAAGVGSTATVTEQSTPAALAPNLVIADANDTNLEGATVAIGAGRQADDLLSVGGVTNGSSGGIGWSYSGVTGTLNFTGSASVAAYQALLRQVMIATNGDDPGSARTVAWMVTDGEATSNAPATAVTVVAINDAPTLTATGANPTFTEGGAAVDLFSGVSASTIEAGQTITAMTLTVTNVTEGNSEVLVIDGSDVALGNGNAVVTAGNGLTVNVSVIGTTATVSFSGATLSAAALAAIVDAITYRNLSDAPTDADRVITISKIVDSGANGGDDVNSSRPNVSATVNVDPVNDPATITGDASGAVTEAGGVANGSAGIPSDTGDLDSADVDNPTDAWQAVVAGAASANGYGTYSLSTSGVWIYTLDNSNAAVQALNGAATLTDSFVARTADGTSQTVTISISAQNDSAVISGDASGSVTEAGGVANGSAGTPTDTGDLNSTDVDNPSDAWKAVAAGAATSNGYGTYALSAAGVWTYTLDNGNAAVQALNGSATLTDSFTALTDDGTAQVVTITINGQNDAPVVGSVAATASYTEDSAPVILSPALVVGDVDDSNIESAKVTIANAAAGDLLTINGTSSGTIGTIGYSFGAGVLTLIGSASLSDYQSALRLVAYRSTSQDPSSASRTINWTVNDGDANSATQTTTLSVVSVNDEPASADVTIDGVSEDDPYIFQTSDFPFSDNDGDARFTVRFTSLPADGDILLNGVAIQVNDEIAYSAIAAGMLTFQPDPDEFGAPYTSFTFQVRDNGGTSNGGDDLSPQYTATINVEADNVAPEGADNSASIAEDTILVFTAASFSAGYSDADNDPFIGIKVTTLPGSGTLYFDADGAGGNPRTAVVAGQEISAADLAAGKLSFVPAANGNGAPYATFTYQVSDAVSGYDPTPSTFTVTVTPVNDAPDLARSGGDATYTEGDAPVALFQGVTLSDPDLPANFIGATITLAVTSGAGAFDSLGIATADGFSRSGNQLLLNGIYFATISDSGSTLVLSAFAENSTLNAMNLLVDNFTYAATGDDPGAEDRTITLTFNDGGNSGSGSPLSDSLSQVVNVVTTSGPSVTGTSGNDVITGTDSQEVISGFIGNDTIYGLGGSDTLDGGAGDDTIYGGDGNDDIVGANGNDSLYGDAGADTIDGGNGADLIRGGADDDVIHGGNDNDRLYGDEGADSINGGSGNDLIDGGAGDDILIGGAGSDIFLFSGLGGDDRIVDFRKGQDKIDLADIDANSNVAGHQSFTWIGSSAFSGAGQVGIYGSGIDRYLAGDVDGDGAADFTIGVGNIILAQSDIIFV